MLSWPFLLSVLLLLLLISGGNDVVKPACFSTVFMYVVLGVGSCQP